VEAFRGAWQVCGFGLFSGHSGRSRLSGRSGLTGAQRRWPPRPLNEFSSLPVLLEQVVYLLAGSFERGGRICSVQINGIKGSFHNSVDVAGVIRDRE
jgi:hypothetical protein